MGLADLTGELMRNAINSLATGNTEVEFLLFYFRSAHPSTQVCFSLLALLQTVAEAFDKLERKEAPRDLAGKVESHCHTCSSPKINEEAKSFQGSCAEAKHEEGGAGLLLHPGQGLRDPQG